MTDMITVLIADDHPAFLRGLAAMVTDSEGLELLGTASDGEQAVRLSTELRPGVVLLDLRMPGLDGIEACARITATAPHPAVLMLTMFDDDASVYAALRAGAAGYLLKGSDQSEITAAVKAAAVGESVFGAGVAARIIAHFVVGQGSATGAFPELSDRERQILELMARGMGNAAMAKELGITVKTVRNHVSNVLTKLRVRDRAGAVLQARTAGFGTRHGV